MFEYIYMCVCVCVCVCVCARAQASLPTCSIILTKQIYVPFRQLFFIAKYFPNVLIAAQVSNEVNAHTGKAAGTKLV